MMLMPGAPDPTMMMSPPPAEPIELEPATFVPSPEPNPADAFRKEPEEGKAEAPEPDNKSTDPATAFGPVSTLDRAKAAGIKLLKQKKARKAIRSLVEKMQAAPEDDWLVLVTEAITAEVGIYYYMKAVTVNAALSEATDDAELRVRIVKAMRDSGLIPDDVPFDEKDYLRLRATADEGDDQ
jgi:hypothetical protein